jgi:hypothetical protein
LIKLAAMDVSPKERLMKLGAARSKAPSPWRLVDVSLDEQTGALTFSLNRGKLRTARRREGRYLLRTNLTEGEIGGLTTANLNSLSTAGLGGLTTAQAHGLTTAQLNGLTTASLDALCVPELTSSQVVGLTTASIVDLTTGQISALSTSQTQGWNTAQVAAAIAAYEAG